MSQDFERVQPVDVFEAQEPDTTSTGKDTSGFFGSCWRRGAAGAWPVSAALALPPPSAGWAGGLRRRLTPGSRFLSGVTELKSGTPLLGGAQHPVRTAELSGYRAPTAFLPQVTCPGGEE